MNPQHPNMNPQHPNIQNLQHPNSQNLQHPNSQNTEGETQLANADYPLAVLLMGAGADADLADKHGWTPLHNASSRNHIGTISLLLAHAADTNASTSSGLTPLMCACARGHRKVCQLLIAAHANASMRNDLGDSCIDVALTNSHYNLARHLCTHSVCEGAQTLLEEVWQFEEAMLGFSLVFERFAFRPMERADFHSDLEAVTCREEWFWMNQWEVDVTDENVDEDGWMYSTPTQNTWGSLVDLGAYSFLSGQHWLRRRRWVRLMKKQVNYTNQVPVFNAQKQQLSNLEVALAAKTRVIALLVAESSGTFMCNRALEGILASAERVQSEITKLGTLVDSGE